MRAPLLALLTLSACASYAPSADPETCRAQAQQAYRDCHEPRWRVDEDPAMARSDDTQACQQAYRQALSACPGGEPAAPVPELGTVTGTTAR